MKSSNDLYSIVKDYIYNNSLTTLLANRLENEENVNYLMNSKNLEMVYTIDEYFYRQMKENTQNSINSPLYRYLNEISIELENRPLLLLSLPMWNLGEQKLRKYLSNYDRVISKIRQKNLEINSIYRRFNSNSRSITIDEIGKIVKYFSYCIPYADKEQYKAQEKFVKFLLNNPQDTKYNYEVSMFLLKFFGYKKIREDKLDDTKIVIAKLDSDTTFGESTKNFAVINKKSIQKVILGNNTLEDRFGRKNVYDRYQSTNYREILGILHTLYHEIRHQKQKQHSKSKIIDDLSYYYAAFEIINEQNDYDYNNNYRCYEIEKDANYKAWEDIEKLIKNYMPTQNTNILTRNILKHRLKEELEQITGIRISKDNRTYISNNLLIQYLDNKFKKTPNALHTDYQQFNNFYNPNGTPKRVIDLLKQPLVYNYKEFYFGQVNCRYLSPNYRLTYQDLRILSQKDIINIVNNIKILMNINQEKMNKISDRVNRGDENKKEIVGNINNYHNFAIILSNTMNELIRLYPNIINILSVKNAIDSINVNIYMINNNSLVIRKVSSKDKISRVGRR